MAFMKFFKKKPKTQKEAQREAYNLCTEIRKPKSARVSYASYEGRLLELTGKLELLINDYNLLEYEKGLKEELLKPVFDTLIENKLETYANKLAKRFEL